VLLLCFYVSLEIDVPAKVFEDLNLVAALPLVVSLPTQCGR